MPLSSSRSYCWPREPGAALLLIALDAYKAMLSYLNAHSLQHFTSYLKADKPIKAVFRRLPPDTASYNITLPLQVLGFYVISVKLGPNATHFGDSE
jgi:hypothetical protein